MRRVLIACLLLGPAAAQAQPSAEPVTLPPVEVRGVGPTATIGQPPPG